MTDMQVEMLNVSTLPDTRTRVYFRAVDDTYTLSDALYFTQAEYESLNFQEMMGAFEARFEEWKASLLLEAAPFVSSEPVFDPKPIRILEPAVEEPSNEVGDPYIEPIE